MQVIPDIYSYQQAFSIPKSLVNDKDPKHMLRIFLRYQFLIAAQGERLSPIDFSIQKHAARTAVDYGGAVDQPAVLIQIGVHQYLGAIRDLRIQEIGISAEVLRSPQSLLSPESVIDPTGGHARMRGCKYYAVVAQKLSSSLTASSA